MNSFRILAIVCAIVTLTACTSTSTITYDTEITSTPTGAEVRSLDDEESLLGYTPLLLDGQLEVKQRPSTVTWAILGLTFISGLTAAVPGYLFYSGNLGNPDNPSRKRGVFMMSVPVVSTALAYPFARMTDNMVISSSTPGVDHDIKVDRRFRSPSQGDYVAALPRARYELVADGFVPTPLRVMPGQAAAVELTPRDPGPPLASSSSASHGGESSDLVTGAPQNNAHALVIGVEDYRNVTPTPGARSDAEKFAHLLEVTFGIPSQNIHLMIDDGATRSDIFAALARFRSNVDSDSRIYFFYSGHGAPDVESGAAYLLPYEGQPESIEYTGVAMTELLEQLENTGADEVLAFVDACFSGSGERSQLPEGTRPLVPARQPSTKPKIALFSSSAAAEVSGNTAGADEGLFTHHLLDALGRARADIDGSGRISLAELEQYVVPRVTRDALRLDRTQTPELQISDEMGNPSEIFLLWGLPSN